MKYIDLKFKYK